MNDNSFYLCYTRIYNYDFYEEISIYIFTFMHLVYDLLHCG